MKSWNLQCVVCTVTALRGAEFRYVRIERAALLDRILHSIALLVLEYHQWVYKRLGVVCKRIS